MSELLSIEEARARLARFALPLEPTNAPLAKAVGLVLSRDVRADRDLPPFDRAAVDGYAIRLREPWGEANEFAVRGTVAAGDSWGRALRPGEAVRIMTGAPVPRGADGVVMVEKSTPLEGERVRLVGPFATETARAGVARPGLSPRGQDAARGRVVLPRGRRLDPAAIAVLASVGCVDVPVFAPVSAALLTTGPEIVPPATQPTTTQIRNSNGPFLRALFEESRVVKLVRDSSAPDDSRRLARAIDQSRHARVLVLTGGVSMGDFDLVPKVLTEAGYVVRFHRIAIRPGKPLLFATRGRGKDQQVAFGLPGNPVSVLVTAWEFLLPYLRAAAGCGEPGPWVVRARALERIARRPGLAQFVLASIAEVDGTLGVREVPWNGSGDFVAAARANALLPLDPTRGVVEEGEICPVHPLVQIGWPVAGGEK